MLWHSIDLEFSRQQTIKDDITCIYLYIFLLNLLHTKGFKSQQIFLVNMAHGMFIPLLRSKVRKIIVACNSAQWNDWDIMHVAGVLIDLHNIYTHTSIDSVMHPTQHLSGNVVCPVVYTNEILAHVIYLKWHIMRPNHRVSCSSREILFLWVSELVDEHPWQRRKKS